MEDLYIASSISFFFFIIKLAMNKINKEIDKNINRDAFKDSIYIFIISMLVLYVKKEFFSKSNLKTQVFTNEPGF
jgi:amino acid permease